MLGGWDRTDVARAQRDLVLDELQDAEHCPPYAAFLHAMAVIGLQRGVLLDVGCGVGHYGVLCERYYPGIIYHGTDASASIIAEARQLAPFGMFITKDFVDNDFWAADIILASQCVEVIGNCWTNLRWLLSRSRRYVILNRLRLTGDVSHEIEETTYCGQIGHNWLWNLSEIETVIEQYGKILDRSTYDNLNQATIVVGIDGDGERSIRGCCADTSKCACS